MNIDSEALLEGIDPDTNLLNDALPPDMCKYFTSAELNNLNYDNEKFSILNYNIRSFHKNGNCLLSLLGSINFNFECIVLSETWNTESNYNLCNIPEYQSFHTYRPRDHIYSMSGGITVLCSKRCSAQKDDALSICNNNIESCVVDLKFNKVSITIVAVYRPPQGSKQDFTLELDHILSNIKNRNSRVTILGDMNINLYDVNDTSTVDYTSTLYSRSMMPLISKPTRFPNAGHASNPSILDHIWTNCLNVANCGVVDFDVTDHLPTFCFLDLPSGELNDEKIKI